MTHIAGSLIKYIILGVLIVVFLAAVLIGIIAYTRPAAVIGVLEHFVPTPTMVPPITMKGIGVLGDSQSDEYRGTDNRGYNFSNTTLNWVEILVRDRDFNFGSWGEYREPRRAGYAYDWARTGATTRSMIESGQHIGLAEQIKNGEVNVAVVFIGANDFGPYITHDGYEAIYSGSLTEAQITDKKNKIIADIKTALETLQHAGNVRIILVLIPDWGQHTGIQAAFPFPDQRNRVSTVISETNAELRKLAEEKKTAVIDPNAFLTDLPREEKGSRIEVGGVALERLVIDNNPRNMYVDDGVHLGTVMNGLFANEVIRVLNTQIANTVRPLSEEEILETAGISQR